MSYAPPSIRRSGTGVPPVRSKRMIPAPLAATIKVDWIARFNACSGCQWQVDWVCQNIGCKVCPAASFAIRVAAIRRNSSYTSGKSSSVAFRSPLPMASKANVMPSLDLNRLNNCSPNPFLNAR